MWKVFDAQSWSALLSSLRQMKRAADANASAVSGLGEDVAELSQATAQALQGLGGDIEAVQDAVSQLRRDIENGTVAVKPVFPVVSADPASPKEGEAWIKT